MICLALGSIALARLIEMWLCLDVVQFCGLFGGQEMIKFSMVKCLLTPLTQFFLCCFWLDTWAILQKKKEKRIVELGSLRIRKTANDAFCRAFGWSPVDRRITGALLP